MSAGVDTAGDARALSRRLASAFQAPPRLALKSRDGLGKALQQGGFGGFEAMSPFAACLLPLIHAKGWQGSLRELAEGLPHFANALDLDDLRNVLANLGYVAHDLKCRLTDIDKRLLPCLGITDDGAVYAVLGHDDARGYHLFAGAERREYDDPAPALAGTFLVLSPVEPAAPAPRRAGTWVGDLVRRFHRTLALLFASTFVLNLLSLAVPLYVMVIYDQVIPAHARLVLAYLAAGVALALVFEVALTALRARLTAYLGGRIENIVANAAFAQILSLPPHLTETATVGAQAARLREFDSIRDLFTGPLVAVGLELPFAALFIAVIALIAGPLALIPVGMMVLYGIIGALLMPALKRSVTASSRSRAERHGFLVEMLTNARTIKQLAAEENWAERYRDLSATASVAHFRTAQMSFLLQTLAQAIMMGAGVMTIAAGVVRVIDGAMTVGALIATMALVWRVLAPLQHLFLTLTRLEQVRLSIRQINQLMALPVEHRDQSRRQLSRRFAGDLAFERVSFRYRADTEPALMGVGFRLKAGEALAIMGGNGAGKSTVLSLIAGLYRPQAGLVAIDGIDIRQLDPIELRQSIAFVPQEVELFHGTLAQNLRLGQPTASDDELADVCAKVGLLDQILALPDGFETRLGDQRLHQLNYGFRQALAIARALLRRASVILFDEAARALDDAGDAAFQKLLENLKGEATIVMVSHRPSHIRLCDKVMVLESGTVRALGRPEDVLPALKGGAL